VTAWSVHARHSNRVRGASHSAFVGLATIADGRGVAQDTLSGSSVPTTMLIDRSDATGITRAAVKGVRKEAAACEPNAGAISYDRLIDLYLVND
jgi:hypothetical protein